MRKILPIWQPVGHSTHIIAKKTSEKFGVKTSHTGTLDPMAEGVIIVLLGEERLKKKEYAKWPKTYEFDVTLGISTDTYDSLGLVKDVSFVEKATEGLKNKLNQVVQELKGDYVQKVPPYSAIKIKGNPLHWYARHDKLNEISLPKKEGIIFDIEIKNFKFVNTEKLLEHQLEKIAKVTGDLRQEEITNQWREFLAKEIFPKEVPIIKVRAKTSKGLYIRSLSQDICDALDVLGFVSNLVRIQNGSYSRKSSQTLDEVFGKDFKEKYDFESKH
jgi:tRNA pseudouridine55 synthase